MKTEFSDADLVTQSLAGNRDAFEEIVSRHQSLLCSLAYSVTGCLNQSEDLAQETFIAAWKQLHSLRDPEKLRPWLCGILHRHACDALRKRDREPSHRAMPLETISESASPEPPPLEYAISEEEKRILWRALERIPRIYRDPLVLFYREHQSVEAVAQELELGTDVVKQRLSRGRKMLQRQVLAFVEGTLERTNPGKIFTLTVMASLPGLALPAKAVAAGAATTGGMTAKAAGTLSLLSAMAGLLVVFLPNYLAYRINLANTWSEEERDHVRALYRKTGMTTFALFVPLAAAIFWMFGNPENRPALPGLLAAAMTLVGLPTFYAFCITAARKSRAYHATILARDYNGIFPKPVWEYRSKASLLGLPLVHIRMGDRFACLKKPVTAWIAAGNAARGGLFAFGGMAIAPISIGGLAVGFLSFGGLSIAVLALGGFALGVWALFGGLIAGWQALDGAIAIGWNAAAGYFAVAHDYALGHAAVAIQANNDVARNAIGANTAFSWARFIDKHWLWLNLLWIIPFALQWIILARGRARRET